MLAADTQALGGGHSECEVLLQRFAIGWKVIEPDSDLGRILDLSESAAMPFYVLPQYVDAMKRGEALPEGAADVLRGVLLGFAQSHPSGNASFIRRCIEALAREVSSRAHRTTGEKLVLDVAASLREEHGPLVSRVALLSGRFAFPSSSPIRSDYIIDVWLTLPHLPPEHDNSSLESIVEAYDGIDLRKVKPVVHESIAFITYAALSMLGRHVEREAFYESSVAGLVTSSCLVPAVRYLRESTDFDRDFLLSQPIFGEQQPGGPSG